jgi:transposase
MEACLSAHVVSRVLRQLGHQPRIIPAIHAEPFVKGQKNDYNDAEAIAEAALRPNLRIVREKKQDQLDLQALPFVPVWSCWAKALRNSLLAILENRRDEISQRMRRLIAGLYEDWIGLDERIETVALPWNWQQSGSKVSPTGRALPQVLARKKQPFVACSRKPLVW